MPRQGASGRAVRPGVGGAAIGSLLRMAAVTRIHVDLATQRPDAEFLKGEALAVDTPIPTPDGWVAMADLQVGQHAFGEDGHRSASTRCTKAVTRQSAHNIG